MGLEATASQRPRYPEWTGHAVWTRDCEMWGRAWEWVLIVRIGNAIFHGKLLVQTCGLDSPSIMDSEVTVPTFFVMDDEGTRLL